MQCAKLSVLIFRKLLRDNPRVLASFIRSGLDENDAQFIEKMIDPGDESTDLPKVYYSINNIKLLLLLYMLIQSRKMNKKLNFLYEVKPYLLL